MVLFSMKGIIFALGFVALYAVFSILSNLSEMIQGEAIDYPLVGDVHWYPQLKLAMFNFYIYALITIFLIYCRISVPELSLQLEKNMKLQLEALSTPMTPGG